MVVTLSTTTSSSSTATSAIVAEIPTTRQLFNQHSNLFFNVSPKPNPIFPLFLSKPLPSRIVAVKAQLNKVATEGSNNAPATSEAKSGLALQETTVDGPSKGSSAAGLVSEESISDFMSQVSDLVKLVDSRDIVELQLKQLDCEILIRKNLVVPPTQSHAPFVTMQSPPPMVSPPSATPPRTPPALPAPATKSSTSSIPPVLSPMAGTFYRCPGPGEPPFVKVGDKVQKGQVLCIIEAMKLMNEIQAEQAGTVVEVIAEDAKPVSKDSPLFTIQP